MSRSGRLLNLLQLLRGRRMPVTAAELASTLGVSERTVYRDIATLIEEGASIRGEAGMGYVLKPGLFLPPLMLGAEEVEAVILGLWYVDQRGDDTLRAAATSARSKIETMLPPALRATLDEPLAMPGPVGDQIEGPLPLDVFRLAIRSQTKLRIEYIDGQGVSTRRTIWPIAIGFMERARVVGAWCELRKNFRTFRIDRIISALESGHYSERRATLLKKLHAAIDNS